MGNILVVPDLHGREHLLNKAIDCFNKCENTPIVFLGDYLDPYPSDFLHPMTAESECFSVFKDLLEFAKENPDDVTLLLGDHEAHYVGLSMDTARFSYERAWDIFAELDKNRDLFVGAFIYNNAIFTHAGISETWLKIHHIDKEEPEFVAKFINNEVKFSEVLKIPHYWDFEESPTPIGDIGRARGGNSPVGGPLWCDIDEIYNTSAFKDQITQIFAHSQLRQTGSFIHKDNFYMCDSRDVFIWDGKEFKVYD